MAVTVAHHVTTVVMVAHHVAVPVTMAHHAAMAAVAVHPVHADVDDAGLGLDGADHARGCRRGGGDADGAERGQGSDGEKGLPHGGFLVGCWWLGLARADHGTGTDGTGATRNGSASETVPWVRSLPVALDKESFSGNSASWFPASGHNDGTGA